MIYDAAIIGTGPAGISAALTLQAHGKSIIWLGRRNLSDKVTLAECIANYPGFIRVTGKELNEAFQRQIADSGLEIHDEMVNSVMPYGGHYAIMAGAEFYEAKTVLLATGVAMKSTLPGESELLGRGVSYCAVCDGRLYQGKRLAVICNNRCFEHEVRYLAELAAQVTYLPRYRDVGELPENVQIVTTPPKAIMSENGRFAAVTLTNGEEIAADGVFILRDSISLATLLPTLATESGHIVVNRKQETNLPGVYAAGDCTGRPYQYAKAVGEGNVAAHGMAGES